MSLSRTFRWVVVALCVGLGAGSAALIAQDPPGEYEPKVGQPGKDVVWVPNTPIMVEKMLDLARVTPDDFVVDLGSGDGRNVIAAAKRGARALGVEFNPDLVALSRRNATQAGVGDKATFVEGDMFEADFSEATVLVLFLLTDNLAKLRPKFLELKPGTRLVANTFAIPEWSPDAKETMSEEGCTTWCTAMLWIVPARVSGTWRMAEGELTLDQSFQTISGTLSSRGRLVPIERGRLSGDEISFAVGDAQYSGRVSSASIAGTVTAAESKSEWHAQRVGQ